MTEPSLPSGWFPDPLGRHEYRYFNGSSWTSDVSDGGVRHVDPLGSAPTPAGGGPQASNGAATAAVVLGSVALILVWIPFVVVVGIVVAVLAIVFGVRGLKQSRERNTGRGASIAGLVMGAIGLAGAIVGVIFTVITWRAVVDFIEPGPVDVEIVSCDIDGRRLDVTGELTNEDDSTHDYILFVLADGASDIIAVDDVAAGETVQWNAIVRTGSIPEDCDPELIIHGPFPFGVEVDPVN